MYLWRNVKREHTEIHLPIRVYTWVYDEEARASCSSRHQSAQPEYHSSLVLIHYLNDGLDLQMIESHLYAEEGRKREGQRYDDVGDHCEDEATETQVARHRF